MLLQACLNGNREPGVHSALPLSPDELAHTTRNAINAGAQALHIHPRRSEGSETLVAKDCGTAIATIRASSPGIPIGVSTALWIEPDIQHRLTLIQSWQILPDYASVNFSEPGIVELCNLLLTKGIGIEAGIWTIDDARFLCKSGIASRCLRLLIEPPEKEMVAAQATVEAIEHCLDEGNIQIPRLLHGQDATTWPLLELALQRGYDTRIGLEDTLSLPNGEIAHDNTELVATAYEMAKKVGRIQYN